MKKRTQVGAVSVEFAAAIALVLPIVLVVIFGCYEVAIACMIYNALNHSAQQAALALARAYGGDATYATSSEKQRAVLSTINFAHMVVSPQQFSVQFPQSPAAASWTGNDGNCPTVSVTCKYTGGRNGLAPFPNPDPLNLARSLSLEAKATAYLEGF
jgi:Flp pilus assembly protein TadG